MLIIRTEIVRDFAGCGIVLVLGVWKVGGLDGLDGAAVYCTFCHGLMGVRREMLLRVERLFSASVVWGRDCNCPAFFQPCD